MESSSYLWDANTSSTCSNKPPWPLEEVPDELCYSLSVDLSNTTWAQRGLINKLPGNACGDHGTKAAIKNLYQPYHHILHRCLDKNLKVSVTVPTILLYFYLTWFLLFLAYSYIFHKQKIKIAIWNQGLIAELRDVVSSLTSTLRGESF